MAANTYSWNIIRSSNDWGDIADETTIRVVNGWSIRGTFRLSSLPTSSGDAYSFVYTRNGENGFNVSAKNTSGTTTMRAGAGSGSFGFVNGTTSLSSGTFYQFIVYYNGASSKLVLFDSTGATLETTTLNLPTITNDHVSVGVGRRFQSDDGDGLNGYLYDLGFFNNDQSAVAYSCPQIGTGASGLQAMFYLDNALTDAKGGNSITFHGNTSVTFATTVLNCGGNTCPAFLLNMV